MLHVLINIKKHISKPSDVVAVIIDQIFYVFQAQRIVSTKITIWSVILQGYHNSFSTSVVLHLLNAFKITIYFCHHAPEVCWQSLIAPVAMLLHLTYQVMWESYLISICNSKSWYYIIFVFIIFISACDVNLCNFSYMH